MRYFNGFSLQNEIELFDFWIKGCSEYCIVGFSYGAIKALEYCLNSKNRIDRLILLSPAYFNDRKDSFKKMQLQYFKKDKKRYIGNFLSNISNGTSIDMDRYLKVGSIDELKELLYYNWSLEKLKIVTQKGIKIEVILGDSDKIINSKEVLKFFKEVAITYYIKKANHILKEID